MVTSANDHAKRRLTVFLIGCFVACPAFTFAQKSEREPALEGYCLVSYFEKKQAVRGDSAHKVEHIGELYYFSSADAMKKFEAAPNKYLPQVGGLCTMALGGPYGNRMPADPTSFAIVDTKLYLFSLERAKRLWEKTPQSIILRALELFEQPRLSGYCPVSYQVKSKTVKGKPSLRSVHKTRLYYMSSPEAKLAFDKEPAKHLPPYWNYCATKMANGKTIPFDPTVFRVVKGRTYFFSNAEAQKQFDANPEETIKKADARWAHVQSR